MHWFHKIQQNSLKCIKFEKPRFEKVTEGYDKYKGGVTKEYIGDNLEQEFNLNNVVKHIATKYNNQIKGGVQFKIVWDDKEYIIPDIYNYERCTNKRVPCDIYEDGSFWFNVNGKLDLLWSLSISINQASLSALIVDLIINRYKF